MSKIDDAKEILIESVLPTALVNEISICTLLVFCNVKPSVNRNKATNTSLKVSKDIIAFYKDVYNKEYASNTRIKPSLSYANPH